MNVLTSGQGPHLELVVTASKPKEKACMWDQLRKANKEGVVFKRLTAPYIPGRQIVVCGWKHRIGARWRWSCKHTEREHHRKVL